MSTKVTGTLNEASPANAPEFTREIVSEFYGIDCKASQLACERDQIFQLLVDDGERFILRFSNPAEDRQVTDFQIQALLHLESEAPQLPLPRIIRALNGGASIKVTMADGRESMVGIISFLPGIPLAEVASRGPAIRHDLARILARLDKALGSFSHPAASHELLWDMQHAAGLRDKLNHVQDDGVRKLATWGLDNFERHVLPVQNSLRRQVIHNDMNFSNVMIDQHRDNISGVLDFGDMVNAPLINDVAVAAAYQFSGDTDDALEVLIDFVRNYHEILPLERRELELIYDLVVTRLVLSLVISEWRASLYPENCGYILRNHPVALTAIRRMARLDRQQVSEALISNCLC